MVMASIVGARGQSPAEQPRRIRWNVTLGSLTLQFHEFAAVRHWQQFHAHGTLPEKQLNGGTRKRVDLCLGAFVQRAAQLPSLGTKREVSMDGALQSLTTALRQFAADRDWEQFHSPKNLASALSVEAAELLEHFQWMTEEQSRNLSDDKRALVSQELADVLLYLLQIADKLQIDLVQSAKSKLAINAQNYPIDQSKGSSRKYDEF